MLLQMEIFMDVRPANLPARQEFDTTSIGVLVKGGIEKGLRLAIVALTLLWALPANAATYWVSTVGSNSNGCNNSSTPLTTTAKLTISAGVACASAGDTVYIGAGTYTGGGNTLRNGFGATLKNGTDCTSGAIKISAAPGESVTMKPPSGSEGINLTNARQYIIFQNFTIDMIANAAVSGPAGIHLEGSTNHIRFLNMEVKNAGTSCYETSTNNGSFTEFNEYVGGSIHDCGLIDVKNAGYGFYNQTSNNLVQGVNMYACNGYGIHQNGDDPSNNRYIGNLIHD